jgi:class 3 adenylate cyclase/tetratricopeptide (TPR) repeat protein
MLDGEEGARPPDRPVVRSRVTPDFYNSVVERRLATVIFVDLVGSTEYVAQTDPEIVRRRVNRYFDQVSTCVEAHGGVVEKFAGDAVMAAFGIPQAHEDDAERAVRAALAIREAVSDLGLQVRIGIESGEVVTEESESTFATGEPVNIAARLQQAAAPGEILIGPAVHRLTQARIICQEREPIDVRGFGRELPVWRLEAADEDSGRALQVSAPFVGREAELELLENTYSRAVRDRRAHLVTIYGEPGVGKSRLAREFVAGLEGTTVMVGRCLPYGEGITYWPLAEMVKAAAGISDDDPTAEAVEKLREACGDDAVADLLGLASGVLDAVSDERSAQEISWAAQAWSAELADAQPLVLGFEDIHWAEEPLLDLIEHLAERVRGVPLLVLCLARPELYDLRPDWGGGRLRALAIELEPLRQQESEELVDALLEEQQHLSTAERTALLEKTEGNPLFLEETVRMLAESGADRVDGRIPDTVQALIAARIDRLPRRAKSALQRAAAIGRVFWGGAIEALSPDGEDVDVAIDELVGRELITRESRSTISGEQAFRFKHVLIRDVAYAGLSKSARAELHNGFAVWLHDRGADELLEIRAYHLDQATRLLAELDGAPPAELASEAAEALYAAGKRALAREANRSARKLLLRAVELEPTLERRYQAARAAERLTDLPAVSHEMETVRRLAEEAGDRRLEGRALTALADVTLESQADVPRARQLGDRALELLPEDDEIGRFEVLGLLSTIGWWEGDLASVERHAESALEIACRLARKDWESASTVELASVYYARLDDERAEQLLARGLALSEESGSVVARAWAARIKGEFHVHRGELDQAEEELAQAHELFAEAGAMMRAARSLNWLALVHWRKGDLAAAEKLLREAIGMLKPLQDRGTLVETQRTLAQVLLEQGKIDEAERYALESRQTVGPRDMTSRATTRLALGLVRAAQGRDDEAETLMREALGILEETDFRRKEIEHLRALADFLRSRDREPEAAVYEARLAELVPASTARIA